MKRPYKLFELAHFLNAELHGNANHLIDGIAALDKARNTEISFLQNTKYQSHLSSTKAGAVVLRAQDAIGVIGNLLVVPDPYLAYAKLTSLFDNLPEQTIGIHPSVVCGSNCSIDVSARIGPYCVLGNGAKIAADVKIGAGCFIGDGVEIGSETRLYPRVTLYHQVKVGQRALIHSGAVIGADGFGMASDQGKWQKIHQLGTVIIGDDVEIGANTTIDRGALEDTIIEDGVKLDNQIQIGHNVRIGAHTAIAGCAAIAGSALVGKHCLIGGGVGINGHIELTDGVSITGMTSVMKSIKSPGVYSAVMPAIPQYSWWRVVSRLLKLDDFAKRLLSLEKTVKSFRQKEECWHLSVRKSKK